MSKIEDTADFPLHFRKEMIEKYLYLRDATYHALYHLNVRERLFVLKRETALLITYVFGLLLGRLLLLTITGAHAQSRSGSTSMGLFGYSSDQIRLAMSVLAFLVLLVLLLALVLNIMLAKKPHWWVPHTATFLLGFMTHALLSFVQF